MNMHERIRTDLQSIIDDQGQIEIVSPTSLAIALQNQYATSEIEPHIRYTSLEGLKQIARGVLSGRYAAESDEAEAHQGELFSGHLQTRYPVPRKRGEDPQYKLRWTLTAEERAWNVQTLRRSAKARLLHADALEAEGRSSEQAA